MGEAIAEPTIWEVMQSCRVVKSGLRHVNSARSQSAFDHPTGCLNTLKHEYPQMGGNYDVVHHSEFIHQLVKDGKIGLKRSLEGTLAYHDPCYLGRYNSVYAQPRTVLKSISNWGLTEPDRHGTESFCCGAGGGRMWMEEKIGKRINLERAEEIAGKQVANVPGNVAVGCPFCLTMIEDGMKELGKEEVIKTRDIAELVAKNMK